MNVSCNIPPMGLFDNVDDVDDVDVLGLCVCVCLLLNITCLFVPQTILTFSAADEGGNF